MSVAESQMRWVERNMPRTRRAIADLPSLKGARLAMSMHLDAKMLPFVRGLLDHGAKLFITTCNPSTVRNDVVATMQDFGAEVFACRDMPAGDFSRAIDGAIAWGPTHLCEMGTDLTHRILSSNNPTTKIRAGLEATGSGINRLQGARLEWPIFNWDDIPIKEGLHNRHMVGLTTWCAFFSQTWLSLHEKRVLVVGYGTVGQGLAATARAFGGAVMVAEIDPARLLQARYDGWATGSVAALAPLSDVIVTATGAKHVLPWSLIQDLREGCFLLNSGHRADEIELAPLLETPIERPRPHVTAHILPNGRRIHLFAGGAMANLTAGEGDSLNAFDITLAVMTAGVAYVIGEGERAPAGVHLLPKEVWSRVCSDA